MSRAALVLLVLLAALSCRPNLPLGQKRAIPDVKHQGFRADVPDSLRGNGVFDDVWWSRDGSAFMTLSHLSPELRVWNAADGKLISRFESTPIEGVPLLNGRTRRFVGRAHFKPGIFVYDIDTGKAVGEVPEDADRPLFPLDFADDGESVVLTSPLGLEVWRIENPVRLRQGALPWAEGAYRPGCTGGIGSTYHEKKCWQVSQSGRWLAVAWTPTGDTRNASRYFLVDLDSMESRELVPGAEPPRPVAVSPGPGAGLRVTSADGEAPQPPAPAPAHGSVHLAAFEFSPEESRLAFGTSTGVWMYDITADRWGPFLPGEHKRGRQLGAMRFSADGRRIVTLGDQLQVSVFDVENGVLLGRQEPAFDDWEGVFRVSGDGSRVVLYHFVSDILEVLDGNDAKRIGYVCPFFCNVKHNPVAVAYAVSPDGRTVVASHRYGAGLWETDHDRLVVPLVDPMMPPVKAR